MVAFLSLSRCVGQPSLAVSVLATGMCMCVSRATCCLIPFACNLSSGEVLGCLESCQGLNTIDLGDLCVTLDIFVLTLPLEIEVVNADILHNR